MIRPRLSRLSLVVGLIGTALGFSLSSAGATSTPIANSVPQLITYQLTDRLAGVASSNDGLTAYTAAQRLGDYRFFPRVYGTTNGGLDWDVLPTSPQGSWSAIDTSSNGATVVVAGETATSIHRLYVSTDSGATWAQKGPDTASNLDVAVSGDGGTIVVTRTNVGVSYSHDVGTTWTDATVAANTPLVADNVAVSDDGNVMVASKVGGSVWRSTNGGATWVDLVPPVSSANWQDISISDDGLTVFAVAADDRGYIWNGNGSPAWTATADLGFVSGQSVRGTISPDGNTFMAASYGARPRILRNWDRSASGAADADNWTVESAGEAVLGLSVTAGGAHFITVTENAGIFVRVPSTPAPAIDTVRGQCASSVPVSGSTTGGTVLTITGTYLYVPTVTIDGQPVAVGPVDLPNQFVVEVPPGVVGPADIEVTTVGGTFIVPDGFTYVAPPETWSSFGSPIVGNDTNNYSGASIALSADGSTLAIGEPGYNRDRGRVVVHTRSGNTWTEVGTITVSVRDSFAGTSVALSGDGSTLAIGVPGYDDGRGQALVYTRTGNTWTQIADIIGSTLFDSAGESVALSANGQTLAIGAPYNDSGRGKVLVYARDGDTWASIGNIAGSAASDRAGKSVALSADGQTLAIGAPEHNGSFGQLLVHTRNGNTWTQTSSITGTAVSERVGRSFALSADGQTLAIGIPRYANDRGKIVVYTRTNNTWAETSSIIGDVAEGQAGTSVALNADGTIIAYGSPYTCRQNSSGFISVKILRDNQWVDRDGDLVWEGFEHGLGNVVALSANGDFVAASRLSADDSRGETYTWHFGDLTPPFVVPAPSNPSSSTPSTPTPVEPPSAEVRDELPVIDASNVLSGVVSGGDGPTVLRTGSQVGITLDDFTPNEDVWIGLFSDPTTIATVKADANGAVSTEFTVPSGLTGDHTLVIYGTESGRGVRISVRLTPPAPPTLPVTGSDVGLGTVWPLATLFFSLGLGLTLVFWVHNSTLGVRSWTQNAKEIRRRGGRRGTWRTGRPRRP
ncbi:MAG: hypothetical protein RIS41_168 [Actinomycetota bacterium]